MLKMTLEKLYKKADKNAERFSKVAHIVVWDEVVSDEENKKVIAMFTARDMAMGEILTKKRHIMLGITIGVWAMVGQAMIWDRYTKKKLEQIKKEAEEASEEVEE